MSRQHDTSGKKRLPENIIAVILVTILTILASGPSLVTAGEPATLVHRGETGANASELNDAKDKHQNDKKEKKEKKDKGDKKEKKDKPGKAKGKPITQTEDYRIEIACEYDDGLDQTSCVITGVAPEGGKKVGHFDIPADSVCAEVIDGDFAFVDPDPHTDVNGYSSRGNKAEITLIMRGEVTVAGTATYWFKVASDVFPATGPGLSCVPPSEEQLPASSPTATSEPATGSLVVTTYTCVDVPEQRTGFDWFGGCHLFDGSVSYELVSVASGAAYTDTASVTATGELTFDSLEAGTYQLTRNDVSWCHAESDNVNSEGEVIISPGERTNVWIFTCPENPTG
jgi:hypothetical protein